jgi:hypothetical protein
MGCPCPVTISRWLPLSYAITRFTTHWLITTGGPFGLDMLNEVLYRIIQNVSI